MQKKILMFTSPTCAPCAQAKRDLKEFIDLQQIEVLSSSDSMELFQSNNIRTVPTFLCIENENIIERFTGYNTDIKNKIEDFINPVEL